VSAVDRLDQIAARANAATEPTGGRTWLVEDGGFRAELYTGPLSDESRDIGQMDELADAEFIAAARSDVPALVNAIRAVLDLHLAQTADPGDHPIERPQCQECLYHYPCPTVRSIEAAL
jgi:hypothetical protein